VFFKRKYSLKRAPDQFERIILRMFNLKVNLVTV
jgi:hypothetical protein